LAKDALLLLGSAHLKLRYHPSVQSDVLGSAQNATVMKPICFVTT
jgi:hypothetical protein